MPVEMVTEISLRGSRKSYSQAIEKLCQGHLLDIEYYKAHTGGITSTHWDVEAKCFILTLFLQYRQDVIANQQGRIIYNVRHTFKRE